MGNLLHRIKGWIYGFVIVVVVALIIVRAYNVLQKTSYHDQQIFNTSSGMQVSLSYPNKISGSEVEGIYPMTISFVNREDLSSVHAYDFVFESPTLLFTDSKGDDVSPDIQISSEYTYIEKSIYVRPFLAEHYPGFHKISIRVLVDGQEIMTRPDFIDIKNEGAP